MLAGLIRSGSYEGEPYAIRASLLLVSSYHSLEGRRHAVFQSLPCYGTRLTVPAKTAKGWKLQQLRSLSSCWFVHSGAVLPHAGSCSQQDWNSTHSPRALESCSTAVEGFGLHTPV